MGTRITALSAVTALALPLSACALTPTTAKDDSDSRRWIAGDHHTHSRYSVGWDRETDPPTPKIGGDAVYPIPMNAVIARYYGLTWMVSTDHGGPNHSKLNLTTGDLISELWLEVSGADRSASVGGELNVQPGGKVEITLRVREPAGPNFGGFTPAVKRIDLIAGDLTGRAADPGNDRNASTRVVRRFTRSDWRRNGEYLALRTTLPVSGPMYLRVRGTNTAELEPTPDPPGENPSQDLWFYSNPVFIITQP